MGRMLEGLLHLQQIETRMSQVRRRLKSRRHAVETQEQRIGQLEEDTGALDGRILERRKDADGLEVESKEKEALIGKLRGALNTAKTNKEYAAILTQMNTVKADQARLEEEELKILQHVDSLKEERAKLQEQVDGEGKRLAEIREMSADEVARLENMLAKLQRERDEAAGVINPDTLALFERIAENYDGEAMAPIQIHGRKPPYQYVCGGCYMGLSAEHANALRVRDEIRNCDNCGRILYMELAEESAAT